MTVLRKIIGWVLMVAAAFSLLVVVALATEAEIGAMIFELIITAAVAYAGLRLIRTARSTAPKTIAGSITTPDPPAPVSPAEPAPPADAATATRDPGLGLAALADNPRLPAEARDALGQLDWRCSQVEARLTEQDHRGAGAAYQLEQIRSEYAPQTVNGYLSLPPETADTMPIAEGKTGKDLLLEQIQLLTGAVDDLHRHLAGGGTEQILANDAFLREKFAPHDHDLDL